MPVPHRHLASSGKGWPTTLRFSRRLGETVRGAEYASAIEGPLAEPRRRPLAVLLAAIALTLGAAVTVIKVHAEEPAKRFLPTSAGPGIHR